MSITPEVQQVSQEVMPIADQAKLIVVKDQEALSKANDLFLVIKSMRKKIADVFSPIVEASKEAKRKSDAARAEAIRQWEKVEEPLVRAETYLNGQITDYKVAQDKIRFAEEERLRQEAIKAEMERRKKEEEQRLAEAAILEAAGAKEEAQAIIEETIEQNQEPVQVFIPPTETPKVELKGMVTVTLYHAEVTNLKELCLAVGQGRVSENFVFANMVALNKQATSLKGQMKIPGVRSVPNTKAKATGR